MQNLPQLITDTDAVQRLCADWSRQGAVAVDTEFLRERTYYPRLCLIQIGTPDMVVCIDPLAVDNLESVGRLLADPAVIKVFHSAKQDFEVLYQTFGQVPAPLFDTQIGAAFGGFGEQIGYAALVRTVLSVDLAKTQTRTRWCARPLRPEQLHYAADDVRYLCRLHEKLTAILKRKGNLAWAAEDMKAVENPAQYQTEPEQAHRRLSAGQSLQPMQQLVLRSLAEWRERIAQSKDLPREWIVADSDLVRIARAMPGSVEDLRAIAGVNQRPLARWGRELLAGVANAAASADDNAALWPDPVRLSPEQRTLEKRLQQRVAQRAAVLAVPASVLATRAELKRIVASEAAVPVLRGWRREAIGDELEAMVSARIGETDARPRE